MGSFLPRPQKVQAIKAKPQGGFVEPKSQRQLNPEPRAEFKSMWDEAVVEEFKSSYTAFPQAPDPNAHLRKDLQALTNTK